MLLQRVNNQVACWLSKCHCIIQQSFKSNIYWVQRSPKDSNLFWSSMRNSWYTVCTSDCVFETHGISWYRKIASSAHSPTLLKNCNFSHRLQTHCHLIQFWNWSENWGVLATVLMSIKVRKGSLAILGTEGDGTWKNRKRHHVVFTFWIVNYMVTKSICKHEMLCEILTIEKMKCKLQWHCDQFQILLYIRHQSCLLLCAESNCESSFCTRPPRPPC